MKVRLLLCQLLLLLLAYLSINVAVSFAQNITQVTPVRSSAALTTTTCVAATIPLDARPIAAQTGCIVLPLGGFGSISVQIAGSGTAWEVEFEVTANGADWAPIELSATDGTGDAADATADGTWTGAFTGRALRVRASNAPDTGTVPVYVTASFGGGGGGGGGGGVAADVTSNGANIATQTTAAAILADTADIEIAVESLVSNGIEVTALPALAAGDNDVGNVDLELAGTAISHTNRLPTCISDGVSACITIAANPPDEGTFVYATDQVVPFGCVVETTTDAVADQRSAAVNCTTDRHLYVNIGPTVDASAAFTPCYIVTTASTNAANCKAAAGNFSGLRAVNTTATLAYLRLYNLAGTPTCSSATGFIESIPIPANAAGAGITETDFPINYGTGIAYCVTGGGSSTDNTNAPAGVYIALKVK